MAILNRVLKSEALDKVEKDEGVNKFIELSIELESPPIVLYGNQGESTGSIISGLLMFNVLKLLPGNNQLQLEYVTLSLVQTIYVSKPFIISSTSVQNCSDCNFRRNVLARWDVVKDVSNFSFGSHAYPFSHLLPGNLPASSKLGSKNSSSFIKYNLIALAKPLDGKEIKINLPINITRSILKNADRNSLRIFPPTSITASALLPNVTYPKSTFPLELKLENLVDLKKSKRWRMRKLNWKINENIKIRVHCCAKHQNKLKQYEESEKHVRAKKPNTTNYHHSNIQTSTLLSHDVNTNVSHNDQNDQNRDTLNYVDTTEVERNAPSHQSDNFIQDFQGGRSSSPENPGSETPTANNTGNGTNGSSTSLNNTSPNNSSNTSPKDELHLYMSETRTISHGDIKSGWKSDFSGQGKIELVANINAMNLTTGLVRHNNKVSSNTPNTNSNELNEGLRNGANVACDIEDPNEGIFVSHVLVVEVVVAEEAIAVVKKKKTLEPVQSNSSHNSNDLTAVTSNESTITSIVSAPVPQAVGTPTGAARVLRMQFNLTITERSGLGISWDDEVPPTYEDVRTLSPPTYTESGSSTPTEISFPGSVVLRTPRIINGVGDTPSSVNIDAVFDENFQDLSI